MVDKKWVLANVDFVCELAERWPAPRIHLDAPIHDEELRALNDRLEQSGYEASVIQPVDKTVSEVLSKGCVLEVRERISRGQDVLWSWPTR